MKKLLLLFVAAICIISCEFTERIYLSESGAVRYENEVNFSDMMPIAYSDKVKDSLRLIGEFPVDTVMSFTGMESFMDGLKQDSLNDAQKEFMKSLDKMKVRMVTNDDEGKIIIFLEEKNINGLNAYFDEIKAAATELERKDGESAKDLIDRGMFNMLELKYDGKKFERVSKNEPVSPEEWDDSTAESTRQMMSMFKYKLEYHFPKRIKSTSIGGATYSLDGKTMTLEVPIMDALEHPEKYNFTVEFE